MLQTFQRHYTILFSAPARKQSCLRRALNLRLTHIASNSYFSSLRIHSSTPGFYPIHSSLNMPPAKRKPVQKETKDSEKVATEMALMSVENKESTVADTDVNEIDNPVEELSKPSKKAPAKKQKKPVDIPKPAQKGTKDSEQVASDTAHVPEENSGGIADKIGEEIDNPDEDAPSKPSRKAPAKKQKKPINDPKALKDAPEDKEGASIPVDSVKKEMDKENVEGLKTDEKPAKKMEKLSPRRGVKRGAHKADEVPSNPAVKDTSEGKEGADCPRVDKETDKDNVEGFQPDEESLKKTEKVPSRRGAKRGAHKADASSNPPPKDISEDKESDDTPAEIVNKETDKDSVLGFHPDEESLKKTEKVPSRRGAKRGAHKADDAPSNPPPKDKSETKESDDTPAEIVNKETDKDNVEGFQPDEESLKKTEKVPSRRGAKRGAHKADDAPSNPPQKDKSEAKESDDTPAEIVNKETDKDNVEGFHPDEESLKKTEKVPSRRGAKRGAHKADDAPSNPPPKDKSEDKESDDTPAEIVNKEMDKDNVSGLKTVDESLKQKEKLPPRRGIKRRADQADDAPSNPGDNVEKTGETEHNDPEENSTIQTEAPKRKRGGKNIQAVKEVAKGKHKVSGDDANNGLNELLQEEKGAEKKKGGKAEEDEASKKSGSEPDEKKSKLEEVNYDCEKKNKKGEKWNMKISSWNLAGLRAWVKKNGVDYVKEEDADIICFQETKCPESKLPPEAKVEGYHTFWANSKKDGYAGVALYSKENPLNVSYGINHKDYDDEGRLVTAEFEKFYLVTTYVPNAGQGLKSLPKRMKWDELFRNYLKDLDAKKPVILCGDLNVAHEAIDLANPKTNTKSAGFTKEERENMTALLNEGFVDSFRQLYPEKTGSYTFWTYLGNARSRNTGWRLDYFVISERLMDSVCDVVIRDKVLGSDHCPTTLFIHI